MRLPGQVNDRQNQERNREQANKSSYKSYNIIKIVKF